MSLTVNRHLADPAMDDIDHALGRPLDPMGETYRNRYAVDADDAVRISKMRKDPHWIGPSAARGVVMFSVSRAGREVLSSYLRRVGDPHQEFEVSAYGYRSSVVATSRSKARYEYWLVFSDARPDLTFRDFCRAATVRLVRRAPA
ncbi:MAG: hypothetical protein VYD87_13890 [Pseudomonadota bacterium]|nr:hypothetical protein [Pseudomonadota bacterium]MEE3099730.1 hypothetical protein [Pseudomonadota bacterium]